MDDIFPPALIHCLRTGESPSREQLACVALHIWRDWCRGHGLDGAELPPDPVVRSALQSIAWFATTGEVPGAGASQRATGPAPADVHLLLDIAC